MNPKGIFQILIVVSSLLIGSSLALAASSSSILYQETQQEDGLWKYEFTFSNTSTNNEYLYSVWLNFDTFYTILMPVLPEGWTGPWGKISVASFEETHTSTNEIAAGNELKGFGFFSNQRIPSILYTAYFTNHSGTMSSHSDSSVLVNPTVVPEPLSAVLFSVGGLMLGTKLYLRRKKARIFS
jgi:hypothetical protein